MPHAEDTRTVPYTPAQMFDLVADVRRYPEFLPWCKALRVRSDDVDTAGNGLLVADMVARFKGFEERFTSRVALDRANLAVDVAYIDGPFRHLRNTWRFTDAGQGRTRVAFTIDFEFRNRLLQLLANSMLERALMRLSQAFIERANALYGTTDGSAPSRPSPPI
jgi:coenzyme Q-binding protein COQ10